VLLRRQAGKMNGIKNFVRNHKVWSAIIALVVPPQGHDTGRRARAHPADAVSEGGSVVGARARLAHEAATKHVASLGDSA